MDKKQLARHSLKWNPFSLQLPLEALRPTAPILSFCRRVEHLAREGGFALVTGPAGVGKSSTMRLLTEHLAQLPDLRVGLLTRPQTRMSDFYREMGDLFGVTLTPHNRWAGTKVLRQRWHEHIESALFRPVLLVDEAQELLPSVLNELRLMSSVDLDSRLLLTVVFAGDDRLLDKLRLPDLVPLGSRVRIRLTLESPAPAELAALLRHGLEAAGNPRLMADPLIDTLAEHAMGNHRTLMNLAADLLAAASDRDLALLDEKLFFDTFPMPKVVGAERDTAARARRSRS
jgi:type II secretory pathway predicted ATPase ExeA